MQELIAIDTDYKGYYFRSRVEARWAVLFEKLGWKWQYEMEGYKLPSGAYLPDFYFPDLHMWGEVKAQELNEVELKKCLELSMIVNPNLSSKTDVILFEGPPDFKGCRTISAGAVVDRAVLMPESDRYYPLLFRDYDRRICRETNEAILKAKKARFEFEWKED